MLFIKAFHLISMVAWFSGLFYLPRLYVYHADSRDSISIERFKIMEKKLFFYITTPAAILTLFFGAWLISFNFNAYLQMNWMLLKLGLVFFLVIYHIYLGKLLFDFKKNCNLHSAFFYRILNEVPTIFLILIIILAVTKPF